MTAVQAAGPSPDDVLTAAALAGAAGWTLDWSREVAVEGIVWKLTVLTARGPIYVSETTPEGWRDALAELGLAFAEQSRPTPQGGSA